MEQPTKKANKPAEQAETPKSDPKIVIEPKGPDPLTPADLELRNHFASVALAEIVKIQILERKAGQEDVAAAWAFRYADRMLEQSKIAPKRAANIVKGVKSPVQEIVPPSMFVEDLPPAAETAAPIAEVV